MLDHSQRSMYVYVVLGTQTFHMLGELEREKNMGAKTSFTKKASTKSKRLFQNFQKPLFLSLHSSS